MTDDELMKRAEEYMDATSRRWRVRPWRPTGQQLMAPRQGEPIDPL